ncbi:MAG: hypothetical protein ABI765_06950, partial [Gemmatimonadota bacterium]
MHSRARSWHGRAVWIAALLAWGCDAPTGPVGPATHLAFTAGPKTQFSSVTFAQVVQVRAEDADGRVVTGFNGEVTVALSVHRGAATALRGTTTVTATDGMASFADLAIEGVDSRNVLIASTPALAPGRSDAFASQPVHLV